ncbi:hypothetical protein UY3_00474 [Chelonia mydas]|uniref:Uncharacterized protein n=1 Tax=Chelonia mydas TaxID=8469 RepID=M7CMA6_CHEMY|nr:hypothetical protein UY3_00474 [Chelonia mydas]
MAQSPPVPAAAKNYGSPPSPPMAAKNCGGPPRHPRRLGVRGSSGRPLLPSVAAGSSGGFPTLLPHAADGGQEFLGAAGTPCHLQQSGAPGSPLLLMVVGSFGIPHAMCSNG